MCQHLVPERMQGMRAAVGLELKSERQSSQTEHPPQGPRGPPNQTGLPLPALAYKTPAL